MRKDFYKLKYILGNHNGLSCKKRDRYGLDGIVCYPANRDLTVLED